MSVSLSRVLFVLFVLGLLGLVAGSAPVSAQEQVTFVDENVTEDTTWTASDGPYRLVTNVSVAPDATLSVLNGTTVEVAEGVTLSVAGTLEANGTVERPVRFRGSGSDSVAGDWGSIRTVGSGTATVSLSNVELSHASNAVSVSNRDSRIYFDSVSAHTISSDAIQVRTADGRTRISVEDSAFDSVGGAGIAAAKTDILPVEAVSGWSIRDSRFTDVGSGAITLHAERVTRLTVRNSAFEDIDGPAITLDAERVRTTEIDGNDVRAAPGAVAVETADVSVFTVTENDFAVGGTAIDLALERNVYALTLASNHITGGTDGISVDHDPRADGFYSFALAVTDNNLTGQSRSGFDLRTSLFSDTEYVVRNNTVSDAGRYGLFLAVGELKNAAIVDNVLQETTRSGLFVTARHVRDASINRNTVRDAGRSGIQITARSVMEGVTLRNNDLLDNAGEGITVRTGTATAGNYTIEDNVIAANAYGITVAGPQTANLTGNAVVFNTVAIGDRFERGDAATGIGVLVAEGGDNVTLGENDIYGNRIGLAVQGSGTVTARNNYWGAESGPYHRSINPEGEGNPVITPEGWATIIQPREEHVNRPYARPKPALSASPQPAFPNQTVTISAADSTDPDGQITAYQFTAAGETTLTESPNQTVRFPAPNNYSVTLWVEDEMGIESANPAVLSVEVTPAPTPTPTTEPGPVSTTTGEEGVGLFGWLGGLLGAVFYGIALVFGGVGTYQTVTEKPLTARGRRIQLLAGVGILIWAIASVPGPSVLAVIAGVGLAIWALGTGAVYLLVQIR